MTFTLGSTGYDLQLTETEMLTIISGLYVLKREAKGKDYKDHVRDVLIKVQRRLDKVQLQLAPLGE